MPNLVGTGLNQVPTNSMLGGMAYQSPDHASIKNLDLKNLSQINSEIADTAVDIFVYDTSKDSDGGAWRKRTQHTSWYNETLNTSTRGSRKEFPAVAVIVAEDNGLITIYDGDDPDLPMWMKWTSTTMLRGGTSRKLAVKNGIIALSTVGTYNGLIVIYFISDTARSYRALGSNNNSEGFWKGNIAGRNDYSSNNYSNGSGGNVLPAIVSENTNDVAITVLPNAPIDSATGLPIPTIAVATNGGVSVIKDDGTVVDFNDSLGGTRPVSSVIIRGNDITTHNVYNGTVQQFFDALLSTADSTNDCKYNYTYNGGGGNTENITATLKNTTGNNIIENGKTFKDLYSANPSGLSIIHDGFDRVHITNSFSIFDSKIAYVTSDYNTGWMHGDIKGAFLSDTDTTNVTQLINNGDFSNGTSNWSVPTGASDTNSITVNGSGQAVWTVDSGAYWLSQPVSLIAGETYAVSLDLISRNTNVWLRVGSSSLGSGNLFDRMNFTSGTVYEFTVPSNWTSNSWLQFGVQSGTGNNMVFDNVKFHRAERDRSVKDNGLAVYGTVTKTAVATGAELVAYSGFSGNNLLVQPYNSNLNPGTGDYSFTFWFKCSATGSEQIYMRRFGVPTVTGGMMMRLVSSSSLLQWYVRDTSSSATTLNSTMALDDGIWHCAVGTRQGGNAKLYIDGKLNRDSTCSANSHDPGTTSSLVIGAEEISSSPGTYQNPADSSSMALIRYSLSVPSAEQVKKIYEDEKCLFHENAKATLHGSSDAVTALAYDEVTDQLHVGTSSGRSDFKGLRRINNTTTAVTTAISAHDEFIIEQ